GSQLSNVATLTVNAGNSLRVVDGIRLLQSPPYVVNGTATVHLTIKNVSSATLQLDRVEVDGSFQDYFGDPPFTRSWPAQSLSPALSLAPGGTYTYEATNSSDVFPGVSAIATAR